MVIIEIGLKVAIERTINFCQLILHKLEILVGVGARYSERMVTDRKVR